MNNHFSRVDDWYQIISNLLTRFKTKLRNHQEDAYHSKKETKFTLLKVLFITPKTRFLQIKFCTNLNYHPCRFVTRHQVTKSLQTEPRRKQNSLIHSHLLTKNLQTESRTVVKYHVCRIVPRRQITLNLLIKFCYRMDDM